MNAIQPSRPPLQPDTVKKSRVPEQKKNRQARRRPYRGMALETTAKIATNIVLSTAAIAGLVQLLPYLMSQYEKLQEIQTEVKATEGRVTSLRQDFNRYFDPQQATTIMQEQSNRLAVGKRPVLWLKQPLKKVDPAVESP